MKKRKHSCFHKLRRRYHHSFFMLGALVGGVIGFNLRNLVDAVIERAEELKEKRAAKKAEKQIRRI